MAWDKGGKRVLLPGRQIAAGERPTQSQRPLSTTFVVGEVKNVDVEKLCMTVDFRGAFGSRQNITIAQPFAGTSSFILGMPEIGSLILFGQQDGEFYPLTYLPNYTHGLENRNVKLLPDNIKSIEQNEFMFRVRKLLKGELALGSAGGVEFFLGEKARLDDSHGNIFQLRSDNNSIISTACNNSIFGSGIWLNSGIIKRNSINTAFLEDNPNIFKESLPRGMFEYVLRPGGPNPNTDPYYTEYLLEVDDKGYSQPPENDMNGDANRTGRSPIGIFSMGNMVGNNPNLLSYGKILRPILFNDLDDKIGEFLLESVAEKDIDTLGVAISWFKPDRANPESGAFFGFDKEGHCYQYMPSATGGLGGGRSMSILARGSKKEVWGRESRYDTSWDMKATGGVVWEIGAHNDREGNPYASRSMDVRTSSTVFYMYGNSGTTPAIMDYKDPTKVVEDPNSYLKVEKVGGKERHEVYGTRETIVSGNDYFTINGSRKEVVKQDSTTHFMSTRNVSVGDAFTEKVTKEKQETFGNRKTTVTQGSSELTVTALQGDIKEEVKKLGGKSLKINMGSVQETVKLGSRIIKIKTGSVESKISGVGNFKSSTKSGQIALQTKTGAMGFKASLNIDMKTKKAANVVVAGGVLKLQGKKGSPGKVITSKTHKDYTTGAYHAGTSTALA